MEQSTANESNPPTIGEEMHNLARRLFPICRSLTGDGIRQTFSILQEIIPIETHEVPSGTQAFDWEVPPEWNIRDAYIKDESGKRIVDFAESNLHVVGYSIPFRGHLSLQQLNEHLYSIPEQPDLIPYITSYYSPRWGFCLTHKFAAASHILQAPLNSRQQPHLSR